VIEINRVMSEKLREKENDLQRLVAAWQIDWDQLDISDRIASGAYGVVWRGLYLGKIPVRLSFSLSLYN